MKEMDASTVPPEHEEILLETISDMIGVNATRTLFNETLLSVLEDVSGFEVLSDDTQIGLTQYFWNMYRQRNNVSARTRKTSYLKTPQ